MLGSLLRECRHKSKMPISEIAKYLGISITVLMNIEYERRVVVQADLIKYANLYAVDYRVLLKAWLSDEGFVILGCTTEDLVRLSSELSLCWDSLSLERINKIIGILQEPVYDKPVDI